MANRDTEIVFVNPTSANCIAATTAIIEPVPVFNSAAK